MSEEKTVNQKEQVVSLGKKLANLRKELGLTENDVANKIHIRTTIIEDIENDRAVNVPAVFLKGYIKSYADIVNLSKDEYQNYLDTYVASNPALQMKNYSNKEKKKRSGKRKLLISLVMLICIVGVMLFFILKDKNKSNLVEVNHYISPLPATNIDS